MFIDVLYIVFHSDGRLCGRQQVSGHKASLQTGRVALRQKKAVGVTYAVGI
jgi:hypothetical protein